MKTCSDCRRVLTLDQFSSLTSAKDGLSYTCRDCSKERGRRYRAANPGQANARSRRWYAANAELTKARGAKWRSDNPERVTARSAQYYIDNVEARREYSAQWYVENRDTYAARQSRRRAEHPELRIEDERKRRELIQSATIGPMPADIKGRLIELYGPVCMMPDCESTDLTTDHIVPLSRGGAHAVFNLQLLCMSCNARKGNRSSVDYRPVIEREACAS